MDTKLSLVTSDGLKIEGLIIYRLISGWYYCFAAFVQEWDGVLDPFRLESPLEVEHLFKIRLGDTKWTRAEMFYGSDATAGLLGVWDERWVDGVADPDFPPLAPLDDEDPPDQIDSIPASDRKTFSELKECLSRRFRWPSTICQFCLGEDDKGRLKDLPNRLRGFAEPDFEISLWRWATGRYR